MSNVQESLNKRSSPGLYDYNHSIPLKNWNKNNEMSEALMTYAIFSLVTIFSDIGSETEVDTHFFHNT